MASGLDGLDSGEKMGKSSVVGIFKGYVRTLRDARGGGEARVRVADVLVQIGLPIAAGVACYFTGWHLGNPSNAIVGISIVSALMCAMATLLFQVRSDASERPAEEQPSPDGDPKHLPALRMKLRDKRFIDEVFDDVMWAILVGLTLSLYLIAIDAVGLLADGGIASRALSSVAVAVCAHFVLVIGMCLKRLRRAYNVVSNRE